MAGHFGRGGGQGIGMMGVSLNQLVSEAKNRIRPANRLALIERNPEIVFDRLDQKSHRSPRYPVVEDADLLRRISAAKTRAQSAFFAKQDTTEGFWWEVLDTNTTLTSEFVMVSHFMGLVDEERQKAACAYLLDQQQSDGGWTLYFNGPSDISTSVEAYFALKLSGHEANAPHMKRARDFILSQGGVTASRVFTKINLALFGQFPWSGIPLMPPQLMLLPRGFTFNLYEFSSWARVVIVPLTIIMTYRPTVAIPKDSWVDELYVEPIGKRDYSFKHSGNRLSIESLFVHLDKTMKVIDRLPIKKPFQETSLRKAECWILEHQDETGDWGGILPAMLNSVMALKCRGYDNHHPVVKKGWEAILRFQDNGSKEGLMHQQSCVSPIWDTAWYAISLCRSGVASDDPRIQQAARYLISKQILRPGDWKVKNPKGEPGGWAFEFYNDFYPDVDDTMAVLTALAYSKLPEKDRLHQAFSRGFRWLLTMQNDDGGWAAFERGIDKKILNEIPFADLKSLLDPSTCDITGRVLEFLGLVGYDKNARNVRRAIRFIKDNQHASGAWWGRWGVNYIYGTWCVLVGLHSVGEDMNQDYIQRAITWLKSIQNPDGGFGESCRSYEDEAYMGKGTSTCSQTAWVILALIAAGEGRSQTVKRAIEFLLSQQQESGEWFEELYTGTGFPKHFYLGYRGYKNYFSLLALQEYQELMAG